jgi:hypothetical protein
MASITEMDVTHSELLEGLMSQPHFEGVVRLPLTLPKMGLGSPLGLPQTQSVIAGVKTPRIGAFLVPWKGLEM